MKKFASIFLLLLCSIVVTAKPIKYLFLFIGDGMSMTQQNLAEKYLHSQGKTGLIMNTFPVNTVSTTYSATNYITDSAASGTAIACGVKTKQGVIGLDEAGNKVDSIATLAKKQGRKVGIISSVTLNHATPAAFYAHNSSRSHYRAIAEDMFKSGFDLFGGGALGDELKKGDLYDQAKSANFNIVKTAKEFKNLSPKSQFPIYIIAEDAKKSAMPYAIDADPSMPTLADITEKAIELLDNSKGFFMMVEGGRIDWACHQNDAVASLFDTIAFDDAIRVAYKFALQHPEETLIVVTADHETGGMTLGNTTLPYGDNYKILANQKQSVDKIYAEYTKLKKEKFDDIKPFLSKSYGYKFDSNGQEPIELNSVEIAKLESAFLLSTKQRELLPTEDKKVLYAIYDPLIMEAQKILANRAGIAFTSYAHTAVPVKTSAFGAEAERFYKADDNTDIAKIFKSLIQDF